MQTVNGVLTQPTYRPQRWEVVVGKEKFVLNEKQIAILKRADQDGMRGMVWFDKFAISIPHIQSIHFEGYESLQSDLPPIQSPDEQFPDALKDQEMREKIAEMKKKTFGI